MEKITDGSVVSENTFTTQGEDINDFIRGQLGEETFGEAAFGGGNFTDNGRSHSGVGGGDLSAGETGTATACNTNSQCEGYNDAGSDTLPDTFGNNVDFKRFVVQPVPTLGTIHEGIYNTDGNVKVTSDGLHREHDSSHSGRKKKRRKKKRRTEDSGVSTSNHVTGQHVDICEYGAAYIIPPPGAPTVTIAERAYFDESTCRREDDKTYSEMQCGVRLNQSKETIQGKSKRKKKRRIRDLNLKKTTGKVGVAPPLPGIVGTGIKPVLQPIVHEKKGLSQSYRRSIAREDPNVCDSAEFTQVVIPNDPSRQAEETGEPTRKVHPKPLKLCQLITRFPMASFLIASLGHIATIVVTAVLVTSDHDVFPAVFDELPLLLFNDARLRQLSWTEKTRFDGYMRRRIYDAEIPYWYRGRVKDIVEVIYEKEGGNVLDYQHLNRIALAENTLFEFPEYQADFCTVDRYRDCVKPKSLLRFFDGSYAHIDPIFNDKNYTNINEVIYKASVYNETKETLSLFLGNDAYIHTNHCRTTISRSFFLMGWPIGRMSMSNNRYGVMDDLESFLVNRFKPEIEYVRDVLLVGRLSVYYLSKTLLEQDLVLQVLRDIKLAIGSFLFIFCFMSFQTGSLCVTFLGIFSILSSYLLTNLIYRYVFEFIYFGFFHVIAIFLILGIGADDLFVFYDTWRLTGNMEYPSDAHRLSDCYRRAAKTTFVTSITTMMAFLVSGLSPLLPVKSFGIFAGLLVGINYISVIIYFPTIIILHHTKIKNAWYNFHTLLLKLCDTKCPSKNSMRRNSVDTNSLTSNGSGFIASDTSSTQLFFVTGDSNKEPSSISGKVSGFEKDTALQQASHSALHANNGQKKREPTGFQANLMSELNASRSPNAEVTNNDTSSNSEEHNGTENNSNSPNKAEKPKKNFKDRNKVVIFLKNGFYDFATKRGVKIVVPLVFIGLTTFFIHSATQIEPATHQLYLFREGHNYAIATTKHYFSFLRNNEDEYVRLHMVWGMREADISACNLKSSEFCPGVTQWDENFDMNSPEAQIAFKQLCERLENIDDTAADSLNIRRDAVTGKLQIACFVKPFENYMMNEFKNAKYNNNLSPHLPVAPDNVTYFMAKNPYIYRHDLDQNLTNHFEILISHWLSSGYEQNPTADYFMYNMLLGEEYIEGVSEYVYGGMYYGTKLRYLAVEVNTTMNLYSLGYKEGMPIYRRWEKLMADVNADMPFPLQRGFQVTKDLWHWIHVQETLANSAMTGIIVGLLSALPLLILTTCNVIIGTLAAAIIAMVTACVVGLIPLIGWKLGVLESINLCMVVGLSVDYIVHMAEAYHMSESARRHDRVRDMLESIGLSVLSGAITTMGAAFFMLFAQIQFLFEFGIFIISTVGISLIFSLFGFTTFLALCGPEGHTGSLNKLFRKIGKRLPCATTPGGSEPDSASEETGCIFASPSVLVDRFFDWLGYRSCDEGLPRSRSPI